LLFLQVAGLPFQGQGSTDHIDPELLRDEERFFRLTLGGRPMGLRLAKDDRTIFVANYLSNSVQVVDRLDRRLKAEFPLGGDAKPSLTRRGEAIFYDATRSLDQWYSCHSCHYEGGTNAVTMDTFNDGTAFTFKTVLPLYRLDQSAPWTWHGWQTELSSALRHSLKTTMLGPDPSDADVHALQAYLSSLLPPPPRVVAGRQAAVERGKAVFLGDRAGCSQCHRGAEYTDGDIHDLALGKPDDKYSGFNTPSLIGVFRKNLLLHDGRHMTLRELLSGQHAPEVVAGTKLTDQEFEDLIAFLESL
jgi:cytochrome c peroxidase